MKTDRATIRLSRNFHCTFKPERQYINALLRYAALGESGTLLEIARATGIPMGNSTGKVPAILDYCRGMGLIILVENQKKSSRKQLELTEFGRVVLKEDPYLKQDITQWIAHFNLCSPLTGAEVWYHTFVSGNFLLGNAFLRTELENHLKLKFGKTDKNLIGPLVGMYEDDASFKVCSVLSEKKGIIHRKEAPIRDELIRGYGAWMIQLLCDFVPRYSQVLITDFDSNAGWKTIPGWSTNSSTRILELIESKGLIRIDRLMQPWIIQAKVSPAEAWKEMYRDYA